MIILIMIIVVIMIMIVMIVNIIMIMIIVIIGSSPEFTRVSSECNRNFASEFRIGAP